MAIQKGTTGNATVKTATKSATTEPENGATKRRGAPRGPRGPRGESLTWTQAMKVALIFAIKRENIVQSDALAEYLVAHDSFADVNHALVTPMRIGQMVRKLRTPDKRGRVVQGLPERLGRQGGSRTDYDALNEI